MEKHVAGTDNRLLRREVGIRVKMHRNTMLLIILYHGLLSLTYLFVLILVYDLKHCLSKNNSKRMILMFILSSFGPRVELHFLTSANSDMAI